MGIDMISITVQWQDEELIIVIPPDVISIYMHLNLSKYSVISHISKRVAASDLALIVCQHLALKIRGLAIIDLAFGIVDNYSYHRKLAFNDFNIPLGHGLDVFSADEDVLDGFLNECSMSVHQLSLTEISSINFKWQFGAAENKLLVQSEPNIVKLDLSLSDYLVFKLCLFGKTIEIIISYECLNRIYQVVLLERKVSVSLSDARILGRLFISWLRSRSSDVFLFLGVCAIDYKHLGDRFFTIRLDTTDISDYVFINNQLYAEEIKEIFTLLSPIFYENLLTEQIASTPLYDKNEYLIKLPLVLGSVKMTQHDINRLQVGDIVFFDRVIGVEDAQSPKCTLANSDVIVNLISHDTGVISG